MSLLEAIDTVGSGMIAQSIRLNVIASNMANIDTTASSEKETWHKHEPVFKTILLNSQVESQGVKVVKIVHSNQPITKHYEPDNPNSDANGYVYASNVNRTESLTNMISASQSFQTDVIVAKTCKDLLMDVIAMIKNNKA